MTLQTKSKDDRSGKQPLPTAGLPRVGASDWQAEGRALHAIVLHPPLVCNIQGTMRTQHEQSKHSTVIIFVYRDVS